MPAGIHLNGPGELGNEPNDDPVKSEPSTGWEGVTALDLLNGFLGEGGCPFRSGPDGVLDTGQKMGRLD